MIYLLKYGIFFFNIVLLVIAIGYYNKYHKLSSTLIIIVLLSILFQNLEFILHSQETILIVRKASRISIILFSFTLLISIIQAGTLSVKYMYKPLVRQSAWFLSFALLFAGFYYIQTNEHPLAANTIQIHYVEMLIMLFILIIGVLSIINKKQYLLFLGAITYFLFALIGILGPNKILFFSIAQLSYMSFLLINEKKSINRSKNNLLEVII